MDPRRRDFAVKKLRMALGELLNTNKYFGHDLHLLRFLKVCRYEHAETEKRVRQTIQWWKDQDVDKLIEEDFSPEMRRLFPVCEGRLRDGRPLTIMQPGTAKLVEFMNRFGADALSRFILQVVAKFDLFITEWNVSNFEGERISPESLGTFKGGAYFVDFNNVSMQLLGKPLLIKIWMQCSREIARHLPFHGQIVIAVNCNSFLLPIIRTGKKIIATTKMTLEFFDSNPDNWKAIFTKLIDSESLPTNFGGQLIVNEFF